MAGEPTVAEAASVAAANNEKRARDVFISRWRGLKRASAVGDKADQCVRPATLATPG